MTYQAIFERADDGTIWGYVPELTGAAGSGDSVEEALASITEAVALWLKEARADGETIPKPTTIGTRAIEVA
ncbi:MAG: type II toxin-antitoxin system HicB family antitoxin [Candidatus Eremiobacteraeota bacterium]|nr:type II toxin-antitoxin system HicB family antitoxin [Candidatus Eremiobacteraeota bacterium]